MSYSDLKPTDFCVLVLNKGETEYYGIVPMGPGAPSSKSSQRSDAVTPTIAG